MATWRNGSAFGFDCRRYQRVAGSSPAVVIGCYDGMFFPRSALASSSALERDVLGQIAILPWPPGEMASRLTTNQEIAGSTPAVVKVSPFCSFFQFQFSNCTCNSVCQVANIAKDPSATHKERLQLC